MGNPSFDGHPHLRQRTPAQAVDILSILGLVTREESWKNHRYVHHMAVCQNLVPLVNIKIAGKWMFIPLKMVLIGIDP